MNHKQPTYWMSCLEHGESTLIIWRFCLPELERNHKVAQITELIFNQTVSVLDYHTPT